MAMSSIRQLRSRTVPGRPAANAPYRSGGPDDPTATDPLGIGATARGMYDASTGDWPLLGPLPDPRWIGFFQTLKERDAVVGPSAGARGSRVSELGVPQGYDEGGTAGDALAGVADSMSGQAGSIESLRKATQIAAAKRQAEAAAAAKATPTTAPTAPPAPTPPPPPGGPRDPTLARDRYRAAQMQPGSLAALRQQLLGGA